jgi:type II secretory pathway pseudopilin PulG
VVSDRTTSRRAVALVDAIVAVIILGVSLAVILSLTGQAIASQRYGEELQNAAMLADEQLNLILSQGPDDYAKSFPMEGACDTPFEDYHFKLAIDGQGDATPYKVSCTITWGAAGPKQTQRVDTLIASRTLVNQIDRQPVTPVERNQ